MVFSISGVGGKIWLILCFGKEGDQVTATYCLWLLPGLRSRTEELQPRLDGLQSTTIVPSGNLQRQRADPVLVDQ